jgi:hypothetical protein
LQFFSRY